MMPPVNLLLASAELSIWPLLFLLGICTGLMAGIFGVGGGFLIVPILSLLGFPVLQAVATSLISVFLSAVSGSWRNWGTGQLNWGYSFQIALLGIPGAQLGAWLGSWFPSVWLTLSFAMLLLLTIGLMSLRQAVIEKAEMNEWSADDHAETSEIKSFQWQFAQIGAIAGVMSGLFGIGGGIVMVPLQIIWLEISIQAAVANSLGAMVAIAASGLAQHTWHGNVLWIPGLYLGMGGILGAQLGTRLLPYLPPKLLNRLFRLMLLILALYMIRRGLASGLV